MVPMVSDSTTSTATWVPRTRLISAADIQPAVPPPTTTTFAIRCCIDNLQRNTKKAQTAEAAWACRAYNCMTAGVLERVLQRQLVTGTVAIILRDLARSRVDGGVVLLA